MQLPFKIRKQIDKDKIAEILRVDKATFEEFENAYHLIEGTQERPILDKSNSTEIEEQIVSELLGESECKITNDDIKHLPKAARPQLTGNLIKRDFDQVAFPLVIDMYARFKETGDPEYYHLFRQGLDIQDLDPVLYEMLGRNPNSMGFWLPKITVAAEKEGFFKTPKTKVIKVPLPILQLTRIGYDEISPSSLRIVNEYCMKAFDLDVTKTYFVKTGTFSSKFDFRNCKVKGEKEVREIGEYLLFLSSKAAEMASPLSKPVFYGVSTTNEWVVREFIDDVENNPCIYHGLPLHTEYRFFIDCDEKKILGCSPYWRADVMLDRFGNQKDKDSPHQKHDYVIYKSHQNILESRYNDNIDKVTKHVNAMLPDIALEGQWSLDIMQNGDDFYLIDMALACESALSDCVPGGIEKKEVMWIPDMRAKI